MLIIQRTDNDRATIEWSVGQNSDLIKELAIRGRIYSVTATGAELTLIRDNVTGIRMTTMNSVTWGRDDAQFIIINLP